MIKLTTLNGDATDLRGKTIMVNPAHVFAVVEQVILRPNPIVGQDYNISYRLVIPAVANVAPLRVCETIDEIEAKL